VPQRLLAEVCPHLKVLSEVQGKLDPKKRDLKYYIAIKI